MNNLFNLIKWTRLNSKSSKGGRLNNVEYLGSDAQSIMVYQYGIGAHPPQGSLGLTFSVLGSEGNKATIPMAPINISKGDLLPGEVYVSNLLTGSTVLMKENGDINITCNGSLNITSLNSVNITSPSIVLNGDVTLGSGGQGIAREGDIVISNVAPLFPPIGTIQAGSSRHTAD